MSTLLNLAGPALILVVGLSRPADAQLARWEIDGGIALRPSSSASIRELPETEDPNLPPPGRPVDGRSTELLGGGVAASGTLTFRVTSAWSIAVGGGIGPLGEKTTMRGAGDEDGFVDGSLQLLHASAGYRLQLPGIAPLKVEVGPALARRSVTPTPGSGPQEPWSPALHGRLEFVFRAPIDPFFFAGGVDDYAVFWDSTALRERTTGPGTAGFEYDGAHHLTSANVRIGVAF